MPADVDNAQSEAKRYLSVLGRRKWVIIGMTLLGLLGAAVYVATAPKEYTATAQLLVEPQSGSTNLNGPQPTISPTDVATQIELLTSSQVKTVVEGDLHYAPTITASQDGTTDVISVTATSSDPAKAAHEANTYANAFVTYQRQSAIKSLTAEELQLQTQISTISNQLGALSANSPGATALGNQEAVLKEELAQLQIDGASTSGGVRPASTAVIPTSPSSPKKVVDLVIGVAGGLVLGIVLVFVLEFLEDAVRSRDDVERVIPSVPMLGMIPIVRSWKDKSSPVTISVTDPNSDVAESYRSLRTSIQFASYDEPIKAVLVTSPSATDGKTSTVSNLGVVFSKAGQKVVALSTDLRRPRLGKFLDIDESIGITSVVIGEATLDEAIQPVESVPGLYVLGAGMIPPNPSELLASNRMAEIMRDLRERFDIVLIDSPPILPVTDPIILAQLADLTLMILVAGETKRAHLRTAYEQLTQAGVTRMGVVLNEVRRETRKAYSYSQNYSYRPQQNGTSPSDKSNRAKHAPAIRSTDLADINEATVD